MDQRLFLTETVAGHCKCCDAKLVWAVVHLPGDTRQKFAHTPKPRTGSWAPPNIQFDSEGELAWYYMRTMIVNSFATSPKTMEGAKREWKGILPDVMLDDLSIRNPHAFAMAYRMAECRVSLANAMFGHTEVGRRNRKMVADLADWAFPLPNHDGEYDGEY